MVRAPTLLFTENETNAERLYGFANASPYTKDAFHDYVIHGKQDAVNPHGHGTKAAWHYVLNVPAGGEVVVRLRLVADEEAAGKGFGEEFEQHLRPPHPGGRRVLRGSHRRPRTTCRTKSAASPGRRTPACCSASSSITTWCKNWLDGDPEQPAPPDEPQARPQSRLAAPVQSRRHLDAGQMGVPVVRGLGPGVSHAADGAGRRRVRQGAAAAVPARMVHAPQRPDSGLRIRVRRRESAGPRLGLLAGLQDDRRPRPARSASSCAGRFTSC